MTKAIFYKNGQKWPEMVKNDHDLIKIFESKMTKKDQSSFLRGFQNFVKNSPFFDNFTILEPLTTEPIWPKMKLEFNLKISH